MPLVTIDVIKDVFSPAKKQAIKARLRELEENPHAAQR